MFDIGWVEMMVVAVVMIVVIGPKDLPVVLHTMGRWIARVRAMARNFQDSIEEIAEETGFDKMRDEVRSIGDFNIEDEIEKAIDPEGEVRQAISGDPAKALESAEDGAEDASAEDNRDDGAAPGDGDGDRDGDRDESAPAGETPGPEAESAPARGEKT
ncbi:MAG: twin-arginine translocase subunit TatB [Alphaproteobacteria bacterium]|nr:twin-arginine translocase subunit TatB [Pseudomonadota bacterium]TDI66261.1 MAG: twin-arginine translocase subunit TatB [Alphaproteobacteria bacterium]